MWSSWVHFIAMPVGDVAYTWRETDSPWHAIVREGNLQPRMTLTHGGALCNMCYKSVSMSGPESGAVHREIATADLASLRHG